VSPIPHNRTGSTDVLPTVTTRERTPRYAVISIHIYIYIQPVCLGKQRRVAFLAPRRINLRLTLQLEDRRSNRRRRNIPKRVQCGFLRRRSYCDRQGLGGGWCQRGGDGFGVGMVALCGKELLECGFCRLSVLAEFLSYSRAVFLARTVNGALVGPVVAKPLTRSTVGFCTGGFPPGFYFGPGCVEVEGSRCTYVHVDGIRQWRGRLRF
jgi:hypothetical protein